MAAFGATPDALSPEIANALDDQGYVIIPGLIAEASLKRMRIAFEARAAAVKTGSSSKESGTRHVDGLLDNYDVFSEALASPVLLTAIHHILDRQFTLSAFHGRDPLPGFGQQGLHTDWRPRSAGESYSAATAIWMLDDFTEDNGATRLVPGTHKLTGAVPKSLSDPAARHKDQIAATGKAGSLLVFNGHLWHSGMRNNSSGTRRALQVTFVPAGFARFAGMSQQSTAIPNPALRVILGV